MLGETWCRKQSPWQWVYKAALWKGLTESRQKITIPNSHIQIIHFFHSFYFHEYMRGKKKKRKGSVLCLPEHKIPVHRPRWDAVHLSKHQPRTNSVLWAGLKPRVGKFSDKLPTSRTDHAGPNFPQLQDLRDSSSSSCYGEYMLLPHLQKPNISFLTLSMDQILLCFWGEQLFLPYGASPHTWSHHTQFLAYVNPDDLILQGADFERYLLETRVAPPLLSAAFSASQCSFLSLLLLASFPSLTSSLPSQARLRSPSQWSFPWV